MEKIKSPFARKVLKVLKWAFFVLVGLYVLLIIWRVFDRQNTEITNEQVAKIHATKLTLDDVLGKNLPPDPGAEADKTVAGIDANNNGIRDDVELAVFKEYPNSAKTRAVLLQYALAMQMEFVQPIVNKETVIAVTQEGDRAYACFGNILIVDENNLLSRNKYFEDEANLRSFVEKRQINNEERKKEEENFLKKIGSYNSINRTCDIDYSILPN